MLKLFGKAKLSGLYEMFVYQMVVFEMRVTFASVLSLLSSNIPPLWQQGKIGDAGCILKNLTSTTDLGTVDTRRIEIAM